MSQELIYTSAPRGLKPGSQGFCTVVCTQGIPANLVQRLEALSGYRHVFPPPDPSARLNPVLSSHLVLNVAGRRCHVLSRVCDAGLDHTQRTNKFAHHVVLDAGELPPGGPAWLLAAPGFMQSTWDGVPKVLPVGRRPPAGNPPVAICRAWQQAAGDAGWGGALAATAVRGANRLAVIVFRPGVDPLPLLAESLALLPAEDRWNVSFCTFFSKLPPGLECQWRCVLEGSPEAIANQRLPGALVIDLGKPPGPPPGGPLVEAARTGVVPLTPAPASRSPVVAGAYRASDAELARLLAGSAPGVLPASSAPGAVAGPTPAPTAAEPYEIGIYGIAPPPRSKNPMDLPQAMPWESRRKPKWPIIAGLAACAVVLALVVAAILLGPKWRPSTNVAKATFEHNDAEKGNLNSPAEAKYAVNGIDIRKKEQEEGLQAKEKARLDELQRTIEQSEAEAKEAACWAEKDAREADTAAKRVQGFVLTADTQRASTDANATASYAKDAETRKGQAIIAATRAVDAIKDAGKAASPEAKNSAKNAKTFADLATKNAEQAAKSAKQAESARQVAERAREEKVQEKLTEEKAAADKRKAVAESLKTLNNADGNAGIYFPRIEEDPAKHNPYPIGPAPVLDGTDYSLAPIAPERVLPKGCSVACQKSDKGWKWDFYLKNIPAGYGGGTTSAKILAFLIEGGNLKIQWCSDARTYYKCSNQLRNCFWTLSSPGVEQKAIVCLGTPESASRIMNSTIKFALDEDKPGPRSLNLDDCLVSNSTVALEPVDDRTIGSQVHAWTLHADRVTPRLDADGNTPLKQKWELTAAQKEARIRFVLTVDKATNDRRLIASLKSDGEERQTIDSKKQEISKLEKRRTELEEEKRTLQDQKDKSDRDFEIQQLNESIRVSKDEVHALEKLCSALRGSNLQYRIVLLFGDKQRVLYTTEKAGEEPPPKRIIKSPLFGG